MSPRQRKLIPWLALCTIYVVWGSTYLAIRVVVREVPPLAAASLRFFVAGAIMAVLAVYLDCKEPRPTRRQLLEYAAIGVLFLTVGNGLVMWAEQRIPSGITALLVAVNPLWVRLFDGMLPSGQPWTVRGWLGTVIGLVGVALVARPHGGVEPGHWLGVAGLLVATLAWTAGALYSQSLSRRLPLATASAVEMLAGSGALFLASRLAGDDLSRFRHADDTVWLGLAYLVVFGSLVGFTAFAYCLNELPASTVSTYAYVNPVVAVVLGRVFLEEPLSPGLLAGAALIVSAVVLTTRKPPARRRQPTPGMAPVGEGAATPSQ